MIYRVQSYSNKTLKLVLSLYTNKGRAKSGMFVIEGKKFVDELPLHWEASFYVLSQTFFADNDITSYEGNADCYIVPDELFKRLADTTSPQGILAVAKQKIYQLEDILNGDNPLIIVLEETNDPGNLGTILRIGDAAGVTGILLSTGCVDIYNPKVLRAAAGAVFHLPIVTDSNLSEDIPKLKEKGIRVYASNLQAASYPYSMPLDRASAIIIGNEARGISEATAACADYNVKLPMPGAAESLNASVACGILVYEAVRQRLVPYDS